MVFMVGFGAIADATVAGSKHDFSSGGSGQGASENTSGEICNTCHAPHNPSNPGSGPLWDHDDTAVTNYAAYGDPDGTMDASVGQPGSVSKLCLSCHDGTVAIDSFGGATGGTTITGAGLVSTDLSDDHPIGFTYDATLVTADGELVANAGGFPLFGSSNDQMERATCHNAHDTTYSYFLRADNSNASALCTTCHSK